MLLLLHTSSHTRGITMNYSGALFDFTDCCCFHLQVRQTRIHFHKLIFLYHVGFHHLYWWRGISSQWPHLFLTSSRMGNNQIFGVWYPHVVIYALQNVELATVTFPSKDCKLIYIKGRILYLANITGACHFHVRRGLVIMHRWPNTSFLNWEPFSCFAASVSVGSYHKSPWQGCHWQPVSW